MRTPRTKWQSDHITEAEFRRMYEAVAIANIQRMVLNTFVTVSWSVGGVSHPGLVGGCHDRFWASMRTWAHYEGPGRGPAPYGGIWVKEVGKTLGLHSHFLMHVPSRLFVKFRSWARKASHHILEMAPPDRRRAQPKQLLIHCHGLGDDARDQWKVFNYLMKGVDPEAIAKLSGTPHLALLLKEFDRKATPQGVITGPRVGRSRSLGPQALAEAEKEWGKAVIWPETYDPDELRFDDHFLRHGELTAQLRTINI